MFRMLLLNILILMLSGCLNSWDNHTTHYKVDGVQIEVPVEVDGKPVPSDPGEEGTKTLLGIDSNDNGVRDDVERYIAARFQGYEHANKERAIAMQYARATQQVLKGGPKIAMKTERIMSQASECMWAFYDQFFGSAHLPDQRVFNSEFKDIVYNNKDRLEAYFAYNEALSGNSFSFRIIPRITECEVDITKIKN